MSNFECCWDLLTLVKEFCGKPWARPKAERRAKNIFGTKYACWTPCLCCGPPDFAGRCPRETVFNSLGWSLSPTPWKLQSWPRLSFLNIFLWILGRYFEAPQLESYNLDPGSPFSKFWAKFWAGMLKAHSLKSTISGQDLLLWVCLWIWLSPRYSQSELCLYDQ